MVDGGAQQLLSLVDAQWLEALLLPVALVQGDDRGAGLHQVAVGP